MNVHINSVNADNVNIASRDQTVNIGPDAHDRPAPRPSRSRDALRILYLTSSPHGDLRVDREVRDVKEAVYSATARGAVIIEHQPAATGADLLNGLTRFRPHVVHFSGHATDTILVFETGNDRYSTGHIRASAFATALATVDRPPTLVVLNACNSRPQLQRLIGPASAAIGMSDRIQDSAAIAFTARLYAAIAHGQSVQSAFGLAKAEMRMRDLPDADLPVLAHAREVNPGTLVLVRPDR